MGGKDFSAARASRDTTSSVPPATPKTCSNPPFYRQFLPSQLSFISPNDPIPSLDDLAALSRHLGRLKSESNARLSRLESRSVDPFRPIFSSNSNDIFAPSGLSPSSSSGSSSLSLDKPSLPASKQRSKDRAFNLTSPAPSTASQAPNGSPGASLLNQKQRVKVKREKDTDSGLSGSSATASLYTDAKTSKNPTLLGSKVARNKIGRGQSLDVEGDESVITADPDWDLDQDSLPSKAGRTYAKNKKRKRNESALDSADQDSGSEFETSSSLLAAKPNASSKNTLVSSTSAAKPASAASQRGSEVSQVGANPTPKLSSYGMRLKLNPLNNSTSSKAASTSSTAASPAIQRKVSDSTNISTRRNSTMPSPSPRPSTPVPNSSYDLAPPVAVGPAPGWELPARTPESFIPQLPPSRLPRAYPTKPSEVNEDFANKDWKERERERDKLLERESVGPGTPGGPGPGQSLVKETAAGRRGGREQQQTPINTFYNYADAFFKTLTEDDLAWLTSKLDDTEPFQMPPLGRPYQEVWEEEDVLASNGSLEMYGTPVASNSRNPSISLGGTTELPLASLANGTSTTHGNSVGHAELDIVPPLSFKAKNMSDHHLGLNSEAAVDARSGPLAERLIAALLPNKPEPSYYASQFSPMGIIDQDEDVGDDDAEGEPDLEYEGLMQDQDMAGLEERIKKELKAIEVLGNEEEVDWSQRADDEISTTLRMVQRQLARQQKVNEMRKARLFKIALDRMAYQDYVACLNSVEKEIETGWNKRLRQIKSSMGKRKKGANSNNNHHDEAGGVNGAAGQAANVNASTTSNGTPQPLPNGSGPWNGVSKIQLSDNLVAALERRKKLQYAFEEMFQEAKHAWQTPSESMYADLQLDKVE